jgi:hypothetical protein
MIDIEKIKPIKLPFSEDEKIFYFADEEGNPVGEPYSYNDFLKQIKSISGVNEDLMGAKND